VRVDGRGGEALNQDANARDYLSARFFATPAEFRAWLEAHHSDARELWVGFHKKGAGRPGITWPEAVDQALCFGWIDGIRKSIDDTSYANRFTPRTARSTWSAVNVKRAEELAAAGQMHAAGLAAFAKRLDERTGVYSHEQRQLPAFDDEQERQVRANPAAWDFFQTQAPSYRKAAIWWVISAKKDETRRKRLATLIADSAAGRTVPPLTRPGKRQ
jgi:uncharacterized protein YdeI (YjbR/CyaY-like superfamily)